MTGTRIVITAESENWALTAAREATGYGSSVISCDAEAGLDRILSERETPDGRPGAAVMFFAFSRDKLQQALVKRLGQCVLTCATTACFNGFDGGDPGNRINVGGQLRYFGDGFQIAKKIGQQRYWRVPVMDGEFVCEEKFGTFKGVAGGNLIFLGSDRRHLLESTEAAVAAISEINHVIMPFPGGIVRSGSKVGSRYTTLRASTNDAFCPTLKAVTKSDLPADANAAYEIVIDGENVECVQLAMKAGLHAACNNGGVTLVSAGNYGGKLGPHHFHLREIV